MRRLPLDSPDWIPIADVHRALCGVTGNRTLAATDLTAVMRDGRVPYLRRALRSGERELGAPAFWTEHELSSWSDGLHVKEGGGGGSVAFFRGYAFFCWRPALAKVWPTVAAFAPPQAKRAEPTPVAAAPRVAEPARRRRKPGPPPVKDWTKAAAREYVRRARSSEKEPTPAEMCQWCEDNLSHQPDLRSMQKLFAELPDFSLIRRLYELID